MTDPLQGGKGARTRRHLLATAKDLFSKASAEDVTIEQIATQAGVSVGTVYAHFGGKVGLALAYEGELFDLLQQRLDEAWIDPSPLQRVIRAGDIYLEHVIEHPAAARLASARAGYPSADPHRRDPRAVELDRRMVALLMQIAGHLKAAMDCGELDRLPVDEAMIFVWGAWSGVASMVARSDQLAVPPSTAKRAISLGRRLLMFGATPNPAH